MNTTTYPGCGHDHSGDPLAGLACSTTATLKRMTGGKLGCAVIIDVPDNPAVSTFTNCAGLAGMVLAMTEQAARWDRPTDCDNCASAWDRLQQVRALLTGALGKC